MSELEVVGCLWKIWSIASRQTVNGWLPHFTPQKLDGIVGHQGFTAALEAVAWLSQRSGGIQIPQFEKWLSQSAKRRFKDTERKRHVRNLSALKTDNVPSPVLYSSVSSPKGLGEAGERETKPPPCGPPTGATDGAMLANLWCFYCTRKKSPDRTPDMRADFDELLRQGNIPAFIEAAILDPGRDRGEHFWQFKDRLKKVKPVSSEAERLAGIALAQQREAAQEAERQRQRRLAKGGGK